MLNKSLAFGLLAASLMIAPTAAFAGSSNQSQNNQQSTVQNSAATNGSTSAQESNTVNVQRQVSNIKNSAGVRHVYPSSARSSQNQNSVQDTSQSGAADNGSTNAQSSNTVNRQSQTTGIRKNPVYYPR